MSSAPEVRVRRCDCARVLELDGVTTPAPFLHVPRFESLRRLDRTLGELASELLSLADDGCVRLRPEPAGEWSPERPARDGPVVHYHLERVPDPEALAGLVRRVREDGAVRAVTVRDPEWIPLLYYLGFDLFDALLCVRLALRGELLLEDFSTERRDEDPVRLLRENWERFRSSLRRLERLLRSGGLRELVESVAARHPRVAEALRVCDRERVLVRHVNLARETEIRCSTDLSFDRPEVSEWVRRVARYRPPSWAGAFVLLPCTARKPYSRSPLHRRVSSVTREFPVDELIVTSPLGIVPRALERTFPAAHYDVRVTGEWTREEVERAARLVERIVPESSVLVCHAHGGYRLVGEELKERGLEVRFTCGREENPASRRALRRLREELEGLLERGGGDPSEHVPRAVSLFQFGVDALEGLEYRFNGQHVRSEEGDRWFTVVPTTGLLALSEEGARVCLKAGVEPVRIDGGEVVVPEDARPGLHWPAVVDGEVRPCRVLVRPEDAPPEAEVIDLR